MREGGGERDGRREREREFGIRFSPRYRGLNEEEGESWRNEFLVPDWETGGIT